MQREKKKDSEEYMWHALTCKKYKSIHSCLQIYKQMQTYTIS